LLIAILDGIAAQNNHTSLPAIRPLLDHSNRAVRRQAARTLGLLGGPKSEEALRTALPKENDPRVKSAILHGFSTAGSEKSIKALEAHQNDPDPRVRGQARHALNKLRDPNRGRGAKGAR
jgi:HEAT repeat protein